MVFARNGGLTVLNDLISQCRLKLIHINFRIFKTTLFNDQICVAQSISLHFRPQQINRVLREWFAYQRQFQCTLPTIKPGRVIDYLAVLKITFVGDKAFGRLLKNRFADDLVSQIAIGYNHDEHRQPDSVPHPASISAEG